MDIIISHHKYVTDGQVWKAEFTPSEGEAIVVYSKDPEHRMARAMVEAGYTGKARTLVNGQHRMNLDIEKAAKFCTKEGNSLPPRTTKYVPIDRDRVRAY